MQNLEHPEVAIFDAIAQNYDTDFSTTIVGQLQRKRVWHCIMKKFEGHQSVHILELNGGTGEDSIWMAQHLDAQIWLTDQSTKMLDVARKKVIEKNLTSKIFIQTCNIQNVVNQFEGQQFDLIFSNFGGFNCLSPKDLEKACSEFSKILKPNGWVMAVVMGKFCWWESLYFLFKLQWKNAQRRWSGESVKAKLDKQTFVETWYYSPNDFVKIWSTNLHSQKLKVDEVLPIGFWLPPSYLNSIFSKTPKTLGFLNFLEKYSQHAIFARAADHFLILARKI